MIRVYFNTTLLVLLIMLSHLLVWYMDHDLHHARVERLEEIKKLPPERMKYQRLEIEASQKKSLGEYRKIKGQDNYVQIPLDRAFDYYLRDRK